MLHLIPRHQLPGVNRALLDHTWHHICFGGKAIGALYVGWVEPPLPQQQPTRATSGELNII